MTRALAFIAGVMVLGGAAHAQKAGGVGKGESSVGIDPTEIIGRYAINYAYVEKDTGTTRHNVGLQFEKDLSKSSKISIGVPLTYAEGVDGSDETGVGDVKLGGGYRFYHRDSFSALLGARVILDTASEELLGDGRTKLDSQVAMSWRRGVWLTSLSVGGTLSEEPDQNTVRVAPLLGWQPRKKYLGYITIGPSFSYRFDDEEEAISVACFLGNVLPNKDVVALGTRFNIEGEEENETFVLASWKRLF